MKKTCYLSFSSNQSYGMVVDDSLKITLDDIRLYGVSYETFGLTTPK